MQANIAELAFSRIALPFDQTHPHSNALIFSQCMVGHLLIRSYRLFIKQKIQQCCIYLKRSNFKTEYLYLKIVQSKKKGPTQFDLNSINQSIKFIDTFKKKQQTDFKVIICFVKDKSLIQMNKTQYLHYLISKESAIMIQWGRPLSIEQDKVIGSAQLDKIKEIVWTYVDTFGGKYKNNIYADLQKRNPTTHNITKVINTVNWILYCQTVNKPYNQIETANWTCFEMQSRQKMSCDRKDLVLTGGSHILMIHLLLSLSFESLDRYKKEYQKEVNDVLQECRKSYIEGEVKVYLISDQLDPNNLIYKCKTATIGSFRSL